MPRLKTDSYGGGDQSWLGSTHGIRNARTVSIDPSAFTAVSTNGYIPSGTPVAIAGGLAVPYDVTAGTTTGAGVLAGFILTDQPIVGSGKFAAPLLDHGRVIVAKVPYASFAKPLTAKDATTIVFA